MRSGYPSQSDVTVSIIQLQSVQFRSECDTGTGYSGEGGDPTTPPPPQKSIGTFLPMPKGGLSHTLFEPDHEGGLDVVKFRPVSETGTCARVRSLIADVDTSDGGRRGPSDDVWAEKE
jgi:hypothetical protein